MKSHLGYTRVIFGFQFIWKLSGTSAVVLILLYCFEIWDHSIEQSNIYYHICIIVCNILSVMFNRFCDFVLIAINKENPNSQRHVVTNGIENVISLLYELANKPLLITFVNIHRYSIKFLFENVGVLFILILNQLIHL